MTRDEAIALVEGIGSAATASRRIVLALEALGLIKFEEPVQPVPNQGPVEINASLCHMLRRALASHDAMVSLREDLTLAGIALVKVEPRCTPLRYNE